MKSGWLLLIALAAALAFLLTGTGILVTAHPFEPGDSMFVLQNAAENSRIKISFRPEKKAAYCLDLLEQRSSDLDSIRSFGNIAAAVSAFDQALNQSVQQILTLSGKQETAYLTDLVSVLQESVIILDRKQISFDNKYLVALHDKIDSILASSSTSELLKSITQESLLKVTRIDDSYTPIKHKSINDNIPDNSADMPECMDCHASGLYKDVQTECSNCHTHEIMFGPDSITDRYFSNRLSEDYPNHFSGDCLDCHQSKSWVAYSFDHRGTYTCLTCHENDYPKEKQQSIDVSIALTSKTSEAINTMVSPHYAGDCVNCHTDTTDWSVNNYDHHLDTCETCHGQHEVLGNYSGTVLECTREQTCQTCHTYDGHPIDYGDTCVSCHQHPDSWLPVSVNHEQLTDCVTCHFDDRPSASHYRTNCGQCHNPGDWHDLLISHDINQDCQSCHEPPASHLSMGFTMQCSTCHDIWDFSNAVFTHTLGNCSNCHNSPANHYPATCSSCHSPTSWSQVSVNHSNLTVCTDCHQPPANHYPGLCQSCHNTSDWHSVSVHDNLTVGCSTCHQPPPNHYTGECSNCHNTTSWYDVHFDHTGYTDCRSCHTSPDNHPNAQCSTCHNTSSWVVEPTSEPTEEPQPTPEPTSTPVPTETTVPTTDPTEEPTPTEGPPGRR